MREETDLRAHLIRAPVQVVPIDQCLSRTGLEEGREDTQQGALPAAVRTEQPDDLTGTYFQRNAAKHPSRPEPPGDAVCVDRKLGLTIRHAECHSHEILRCAANCRPPAHTW